MVQNMGRGAAAAMFQRNQILANQQEWLNYVQARDGGAFQPSPGGGYLHEEYLPGERQQSNTYLKYYQQQQAKQLAFQRQRFLNAQSFQNNYMLQQQKAMDAQLEEKREQDQNEQDLKRQLDYNSKEIDALENHPEMDKNHWTYKERMQQLLDDRYKLETGLNRNTPQVHQKDSGFTKTVIDPETGEKKEEPIMSEFWMGPDDKPVWITEGKDVAANQLERDKFEQAKIDAARKANMDQERLELDKEKAETERAAQRLKQKQDERKESGADVDPIAAAKKAHGTAAFKSLLDERKIEIASDLERDLGERFSEASEPQKRNMVNEELRQRDDANLPVGIGRLGTPTKGEVQEEAIKRYDRTQPTPDDELDEQAMYESPMDPGMEPEFSDEQFAGTEPAGLYDPTGQPLPMDGGMYNGLA